jgi:hypothetical protein
MIDNAQAKVKLNEAVEAICGISGTELAQMPSRCAKFIVNLKAASDRVKASKPHISPNDGDDSFHGA